MAAYGIVKRIDQVPLNLSMGLCQGFMPLVGYNFAAGNYRRMRQVSLFSWKTALGMSACFVACFALFAPQILHLFLPRGPDQCPGGLLPADRLRLAVPLTAVNFLISYTLQAMGKGAQSALLTFSRQGLLNIPPAASHELDLWPVRHDLDPAGGGGHHASRLPGDVHPAPSGPWGP